MTDILWVTLAGTAIPLLIKLAQKRRTGQGAEPPAHTQEGQNDPTDIYDPFITQPWLDIRVTVHLYVSPWGEMTIAFSGEKKDENGSHPLTLAEVQSILQLANAYVDSPEAHADWLRWAMGNYQGPDPDEGVDKDAKG